MKTLLIKFNKLISQSENKLKTMEEHINSTINNKKRVGGPNLDRSGFSKKKAVFSHYEKKNWRLVQLMTSLEDSASSRVSFERLTSSYKNEVIYKNTYITNPLIYMPPSVTKVGQSISTSFLETFNNAKKESIEKVFILNRFPVKANFVAQWLSENIVSSKTYKLSLLCDRVIKTAPLSFKKAPSVVSTKGTKTKSKEPILVGIKIVISGRILGAEIATSKTFKAGQIPSNTISVLKDKGFALAKTRSGTIGIKVIYFWKA